MSEEPIPSRPSEQPCQVPNMAKDIVPMMAGLTVGPRRAALDLLFDGSFDYPAVEEYFGADSFTYESPEGK